MRKKCPTLHFRWTIEETWSGFQLNVESNQAITFNLVLVLLLFEISREVSLVSNWFGFSFAPLNSKSLLKELVDGDKLTKKSTLTCKHHFLFYCSWQILSELQNRLSVNKEFVMRHRSIPS